jgi:hypothetical protein
MMPLTALTPTVMPILKAAQWQNPDTKAVICHKPK